MTSESNSSAVTISAVPDIPKSVAEPLPPSPGNKRKRVLGLLAVGFLLVGIGVGAHWALIGRYQESTDNAYVGGNIVWITPQVAGTVVSIHSDDTKLVNEGQVLVKLDRAAAAVSLAQAQANLADTVRAVRSLFIASEQARETIAQKRADVDRARAELARAQAAQNQAQADYDKRQAVFAQRLLSKEEMDHAKAGLDQAVAAVNSAHALQASTQAALSQAQIQLANTNVEIENTTIETHPRVLQAAAHFKEAYLTDVRSTILAPITGYVTKRSVQVGQWVTPGESLMSVVPADQLWVDANFKEGQLTNIRLGQPVELTADVYGGEVTYQGRVAGIGMGTGGAFALLPAQNATGNWIKIVQRVPVRITLDTAQLKQYPLRIGLSMQVTVDIRDTSGDRLSQRANDQVAYATPILERQMQDADALIAGIIAAHRGNDAHAATPPQSLRGTPLKPGAPL